MSPFQFQVVRIQKPEKFNRGEYLFKALLVFHTEAYLCNKPKPTDKQINLKPKIASSCTFFMSVFRFFVPDIDILEFRECVKQSREIFAQPAFEPFRGAELQPGISVRSDAEIDAFVRQKADSAYHPSCTCKMGRASDPMAVVDPETRVHGLQGLRVVDASIMPSIVSGNLNAPTIMIAEKAADAIKGLPPLHDQGVPVYQPASLKTQRWDSLLK